MGIQKTFEKIGQAQVVLYLLDAETFEIQQEKFKFEIENIKSKHPHKQLGIIANKADKPFHQKETGQVTSNHSRTDRHFPPRKRTGIELLTNASDVIGTDRCLGKQRKHRDQFPTLRRASKSTERNQQSRRSNGTWSFWRFVGH